MDRMLGELEGKPALPSETPAPSPPPDRRGEGTDAEVASPKRDTVQMSPTGPCPPTWWQRRDARGFLEGIGGPAASQTDAEAHARLDVAKTLEVKIASKDTIQQQETTGGDFS